MFAHYTIPLSSLCRLLWRHCTYTILVRHILSTVCLRLIQSSQLSFMQYIGLYVFNLHISLQILCWCWEYAYFTLWPSWNRNYEPSAIFLVLSNEKSHALYILLCSYRFELVSLCYPCDVCLRRLSRGLDDKSEEIHGHQKQVSTAAVSNYKSMYLLDVICCPCPLYLLLAC